MPNGLSLPPTVSFPLLATDGSAAAPSYSFASETNTGMYYASSSIRFSVAGTAMLRLAGSNLQLASGGQLGWSSGVIAAVSDLFLHRYAANSLLIGNVANATPTAQTLTVGEAARSGTDTDTAGSGGTFRSGLGTGTGALSTLVFQTPTVAAAGTGAQTYATRLTIATAGLTSTVPLLFSADNTIDIGATGATRPRTAYLGTSLLIQSTAGLIGFGSTEDLRLSRFGAASLQQGLANSATPIAQTFTLGESSRGGTDTDVAGSSGTIRPGNGTGAATGSSIIISTPTAGASSSTAQTYNTRLTINQTSVLAAVAYDTSSVYKVSATQVVGARATGWGTSTGTFNKTNINGGVGETAAVLTQRIAAILDMLLTHGLIGP